MRAASIVLRCAVVFALVIAVGCDGTEAGNPIDPRDAGGDGGGGSDGGAGEDAGDITDAGPGGDAGGDGGLPCTDPDAGVIDACEHGDVAAECTCTPGTASPLATQATGNGGWAELVGPTSSGGLVAIHAAICESGCTELEMATLRAHRLDATGAPAGDPIELTRSFGWLPFGAVLEGDVLAVLWGDERAGPDGISNLWFARVDVSTGAWLTEPRLVLMPSPTLFSAALARAASGYAIAYAVSPTDAMPTGERAVKLATIDDAGAIVGAPVDVAVLATDLGPPVTLARRADGFATVIMHESAIRYYALDASGAVIAEVSLADTPGARGIRTAIATAASGHVVGWTILGEGTSVAKLDDTGTITLPATRVASGSLGDVLERSDGTIAVAWLDEPCFVTSAAYVALLSSSAAPTQPPILLAQDSHLRSYVSLVETPTGLRAAYGTWGPDASTEWIVESCGGTASP